ncbi:MAG: quinone-dependent dihydroorotate dehydrogenase [Vulcanimicrobiota bacterium]
MYESVLRPLLFRFDSETVHHLASDGMRQLCRIRPLQRALTAVLQVQDPVQLLGLTFPNRIGLAAGFDKNARFIAAAEALGFGHVEVGAVTPRPQPGHPRPRLFRLPQQQGLRNRMGFNNEGALAVGARLARRSARIPVGVNLGKGKETPLEGAAEDYCASLELLFGYSDFFVVNVSSPNTEGLRDLQSQLASLLERLQASNQLCSDRFGLSRRPILVKVSPDLEDESLARVAEVLTKQAAGVVATNTTSLRQGALAGVDPLGGVSGRPLRERALEVVSRLRQLTGRGYPIIGVGGVDDPESARAMRAAGADLVQIYTGFVYRGPGLPHRLALALRGG